MPLFKVQDNDRPMWVAAANYEAALMSWSVIIASENEQIIADVEPPLGIQFICDDFELLVDANILEDLRAAKNLE